MCFSFDLNIPSRLALFTFFQITGIAKNSDWFIAPFAPVLIGQIKYHKILFVFPMLDWD